MSVYGDVSTMSLRDLLRWASATQKTGVLELERNKICSRIELRKGWISGCSSDDPPSRLGQFLLSRGKIDEAHLRQALALQERNGRGLGLILLEMGALTAQALAHQIAAKAEETIQGLFDAWPDAIFRFHEGATLEPDQIEVRLPVEDVLTRGAARQEELHRIRDVFTSSGIVLRRATADPPAALLDRPMARRIFESIDGERTLAEVLLHAHASEFVVLKFLYRLHGKGLVETAEVRSVGGDRSSLLDRGSPGRPRRGFAGPELQPAPAPDPGASAARLDAAIHSATDLIAKGDYERALDLLNACYRAHPGDDHLRRLIARAEAAVVESAWSQELLPSRIPVPIEPDPARPADHLGPEASFLLSQIDGRSDIQSLLWLAPLREVDTLKALRQMRDRGLIRLDPAS